ncbi:hypothetical protein [Aliihoeflea sp. PC F10.4]
MIEFTDRTRRKIRNAQAELVEEAGVAKTIELTHKSKSVVYRWKDETADDIMSIPEVLRVEGYTRRPIVTREMALFSGAEMTVTPSGDATCGTLTMHVAEMVEYASRLVVETARAKADGIVTRAEATRLLDLLASAERLIPAIKDQLVGVQVDGPLKVVSGGGQG